MKYQLALFQIDSMRKEGKFVGADGSIPEGQGIVMAHLNECHELVEMVCFILFALIEVCVLIAVFRLAQRGDGRGGGRGGR